MRLKVLKARSMKNISGGLKISNDYAPRGSNPKFKSNESFSEKTVRKSYFSTFEFGIMPFGTF